MRTTTVATAATLLLIAACDTSVTNPGLIGDDALDKPESWSAVALGGRRALADAIGSSGTTGGQLLYWGAAGSFQIKPPGSPRRYWHSTGGQTGPSARPTKKPHTASADNPPDPPETP